MDIEPFSSTFDSSIKRKEIMTILANTKENNAMAKALKKISQTKWVGNTVHETLGECLAAINLDSKNSGWYNPLALHISGLTGIYMINEDGSIFCEARVIKKGAKEFLIEYITMDGWNQFEDFYSQILED